MAVYLMRMVNEKSFGAVTEMRNPTDVNTYLKSGWELVNTYTRLSCRFGEVEKVGDENLVYVLGWPREKGPEVHHDCPMKNCIDPLDAGVC